jgi:hypothetical protein
MKIIQSFSQFDEGSPYMIGIQNKYDPKLNFYSFLLSYLTLNKYYGGVTMHTNKMGYESIVKFIPYDKIKIFENNNKDFTLWNKYKLDIMRQYDEDIIHVDSDVFLFDNIFREFIDNDNYDLIVQDIISKDKNFVQDFCYDNESTLVREKILDIKKYDGRCVSCGVFGMRNTFKNLYFEAIDIMHFNMKKNIFKNVMTPVMILEELTAYMIANMHDLKIYDVLPHDLVVKHGVRAVGDKVKYTHMWFNTKFSERNIKLMKNKIKKDFPDQYHLIERFETDVLDKKLVGI